MWASVVLPSPGGPVSYTHLDVYKRQLKGNPAIASAKLESILAEIDTAVDALRAENTKLGQTLRNNEWLMAIKQRTGIPGGVCEFDVPSYHYWLNLGPKKRREDLVAWLNPLLPMQQAITIILHILRGSGAKTKLLAKTGVYQETVSYTHLDVYKRQGETPCAISCSQICANPTNPMYITTV